MLTIEQLNALSYTHREFGIAIHEMSFLKAIYAAGEAATRERNEKLEAALRPFAVYGRTGSRDVEVAQAIEALKETK